MISKDNHSLGKLQFRLEVLQNRASCSLLMSPIFFNLEENPDIMEILSDPAVVWFLIGLGLLLLELVLPGLVIIFFGAGAWITALACVLHDFTLNWQILIFLVASLLGLVLLRKYLKRKFFGKRSGEVDDQLEEFIGRKAQALEDFSEGMGKVEFKGTHWTARCEDPVAKGQWVTIVSKESLILKVKP
jgi:membrane protein implicated in regulation of membrane protease activity